MEKINVNRAKLKDISKKSHETKGGEPNFLSSQAMSRRAYCFPTKNKVYQTANFAMVEAYWNIEKSIIEEQGGNEKAEYGTGLLKELKIRDFRESEL